MNGPQTITAGGTFTVSIPDGVKQTDCVITNQLVRASPFGQSQQFARLSDIVELYKLMPGAPNASGATLSMKLYSGGSCDANGGVLLQTFPLTLQINSNGTGTVNGDAAFPTGGFALPSGTTSPATNTFSWRLTYSGDSFNNAFDVCNESATTTLTDQRPYNVQK